MTFAGFYSNFEDNSVTDDDHLTMLSFCWSQAEEKGPLNLCESMNTMEVVEERMFQYWFVYWMRLEPIYAEHQPEMLRKVEGRIARYGEDVDSLHCLY